MSNRSANGPLAGIGSLVFEIAPFTETLAVESKRRTIKNRFSLLALTALLLLDCDQAGFRNGFSPGDLEIIDGAKVHHLADGVLAEEGRSGRKTYYLIESTVADYQLTAEGLDIELEGEKAGTYSTSPAPEGYVAA